MMSFEKRWEINYDKEEKIEDHYVNLESRDEIDSFNLEISMVFSQFH